MTGSASKAEKGPNFIKQTFTKKGVGKFSKNLHFWNQQGVSFRVVCFVCFEPSDPFQRTVHGKHHSGNRRKNLLLRKKYYILKKEALFL